MPATKPAILNKRHNTKQENEDRALSENAMTPDTVLSLAVPAQLRRKGFAYAAETWRRVVGLYAEVDGVIATAFDHDLLLKYCLLEQEVIELEEMRKSVKNDWESQKKVVSKMKANEKNLKEYLGLWEIVNGLFQRFQGMDARLDGKRKLSHSIAQSLYLTPRSRAGVDPRKKEPQTPDEFADFDK